ncbi:MAG: hypothetical protein M3P92_11025 [Actinomycetota bacterium]|nr:hypothetical protein [Actinomycetota bacterium]
MKRILLLATVGVVLAAMLVASDLSVGSAQEKTTGQVAADVCAPLSKAWDISEGYWSTPGTGGATTPPPRTPRSRRAGT